MISGIRRGPVQKPLHTTTSSGTASDCAVDVPEVARAPADTSVAKVAATSFILSCTVRSPWLPKEYAVEQIWRCHSAAVFFEGLKQMIDRGFVQLVDDLSQPVRQFRRLR